MHNFPKIGKVDIANPYSMVQSILLGERPVQIEIYRKVPDPASVGLSSIAGISTKILGDIAQGNLVYAAMEENVLVIPDCYLNSRTGEITEMGIAGKNISGVYLTPIWQMKGIGPKLADRMERMWHLEGNLVSGTIGAINKVVKTPESGTTV